MLTHFHDVNAYVEQQKRYGSNRVKLELDEDTNTVTLALIDVYDAEIADVPLLVDKSFDNLDDAIKFYEDVAHQLSQGDVVRRFENKGETVRSSYDSNNSRYPS